MHRKPLFWYTILARLSGTGLIIFPIYYLLTLHLNPIKFARIQVLEIALYHESSFEINE